MASQGSVSCRTLYTTGPTHMRRQFVVTLERVLEEDPRVVLLLGDIGVFGFRNSFAKFPMRTINIGILEQASVSVAAGLAKEGLIPFFHSIAPFVVERAFEQIKVDFGYQELGGNFVTAGGSYDYPALGCTHHCPGDVSLLLTVPGMEIHVPGHPEELAHQISTSYANGKPTYYRLSERSNSAPHVSANGKMTVIREGAGPVVLAIGPMLDLVIQAMAGTDATILYTNTVWPMDDAMLRHQAKRAAGRVMCVEPWYEGTLAPLLQQSLRGMRTAFDFLGVPRRFLTAYGGLEEHDIACGLTPPQIRLRFDQLTHV
ncbi:MAG: transketolase family protein [Terrimicrobiaceae bacterium]